MLTADDVPVLSASGGGDESGKNAVPSVKSDLGSH
jgi:hypothetical protein